MTGRRPIDIDGDTDLEELSEWEIIEEFAARLYDADPDGVDLSPDSDCRRIKRAVDFLIEVRRQQTETDL